MLCAKRTQKLIQEGCSQAPPALELHGRNEELWGVKADFQSRAMSTEGNSEVEAVAGDPDVPQWGVVERADGPAEPSIPDVEDLWLGASLQKTPSASAFPPSMPLPTRDIPSKKGEREKTWGTEIYKRNNLTQLDTRLSGQWVD